MAISVTKADVRPLPGAIIRRYTPGGSINAGDPVFIGTAAGTCKKATANASLSAQARGIAVANQDGGTTFGTKDRVDVVMFGPVAGYSGQTKGLRVYVGGTSTALAHTAPVASKVAGTKAYQHVVGWSDATNILFVSPSMATPATG